MKIEIETDRSLAEPEVLLRCAAVDESIAAIVASLRMHDRRLNGTVQGETCAVPAGEILYIESIDGRCFAYSATTALEMPLRLIELEERLADAHFVRIAKNCLVNLCRIAGLKPYVGGRLLARLDNNEEIVISRKYASAIKKLLGA